MVISGNSCSHGVHTLTIADPLTAVQQLTPLSVVAAQGGSGELVRCARHSSLSHTFYC